MTCPRCGAPVPAGARFCANCGLATSYGAPQPSPYNQPAAASAGHPLRSHPAPGYPPTGMGGTAPQGIPTVPYGAPAVRPGGHAEPYVPRQRSPLDERVVSTARLLQVLAGLACLVHGVLAMTMRRAAYVDLGAGRGGSAGSDQLNVVLLSIASVASLVALAAALLVLLRGRGRSPVSGAGLSLFGVGWAVVLVGAALVAGADTRAEADIAAAASVLVGVGFVGVALGHALLSVGLRAPAADGSLATAPYPGPDPYVGTPLARDPADRPVPGGGPPR